MRNRYTPFGYCVRNGVITIQTEESEIVQRIFSEYIGGQSLKKIAEDEEHFNHRPFRKSIGGNLCNWMDSEIQRPLSD